MASQFGWRTRQKLALKLKKPELLFGFRPKINVGVIATAVISSATFVGGILATEFSKDFHLYLNTRFGVFDSKPRLKYSTPTAPALPVSQISGNNPTSSMALKYAPKVTISNDDYREAKDVELVVVAPSGCTLNGSTIWTNPARIAPLMHVNIKSVAADSDDVTIGLIEKRQTLVLTFDMSCTQPSTPVKLHVDLQHTNCTPQAVDVSRLLKMPLSSRVSRKPQLQASLDAYKRLDRTTAIAYDSTGQPWIATTTAAVKLADYDERVQQKADLFRPIQRGLALNGGQNDTTTTLTYDNRGRKVTYTLDAFSDLAQNGEQSEEAKTYTWDALNRLTAISAVDDSDGSPTMFSYDAVDRPLSITHSQTFTATPVFFVPNEPYTSAQTVSLSEVAPGANIYYTIDRSIPTTSSTLSSVTVTSARNQDGGAMRFAYDAYGNSVLANQDGGTARFAYDGHDRLIRASDQASGTMTYAYDLNGNVRSVSTSGGLTVYSSKGVDNRLTLDTRVIVARNYLTAIGRYLNKDHSVGFDSDAANSPDRHLLSDRRRGLSFAVSRKAGSRNNCSAEIPVICSNVSEGNDLAVSILKNGHAHLRVAVNSRMNSIDCAPEERRSVNASLVKAGGANLTITVIPLKNLDSPCYEAKEPLMKSVLSERHQFDSIIRGHISRQRTRYD